MAIKPQPNTVLEALVSHHVLMRAGDPPAIVPAPAISGMVRVAFCRAPDASGDRRSGVARKAEGGSFNRPLWEESILFACERLARGEPETAGSLRRGHLAAFEVDPILAAEMIFRSTDAVWARIASTIHGTCWAVAHAGKSRSRRYAS